MMGIIKEAHHPPTKKNQSSHNDLKKSDANILLHKHSTQNFQIGTTRSQPFWENIVIVECFDGIYFGEMI
jgi:hypothetical protein